MEALFFGLLVFILGSLVVANAWAVIDAKMATTAAAREAARALAQAPGGADPQAVATQAATDAMSAEGRDATRVAVSVAGTLSRCTRISVEVRYRQPLVVVPILGGFGSGFVTAARRSELVDPYRSGLPGVAECAAS